MKLLSATANNCRVPQVVSLSHIDTIPVYPASLMEAQSKLVGPQSEMVHLPKSNTFLLPSTPLI